MSTIESAIERAPGIVGVSAKHLETGKQIRHKSDELFFMASTLKIPVLVELFRQVDQGKIDLRKRVTFVDRMKAPGGGVLKELGEGIQFSLHDLAMLMIIISDNSATDVLYKLVGKDNTANMLKQLGFTATRIPMFVGELMYNVVGLDANDPNHTNEMVSDRLLWRKIDLNADAFSEERADVSSPDEMVRLLEKVYGGEVLSTASTEDFLDIMRRQQLNTVIPLQLPAGTRIAHKTGSHQGGVRCDVGIVYGDSGPYAVAIMAKQVSGLGLEVDLRLSEISKAIHYEMAAEEVMLPTTSSGQ